MNMCIYKEKQYEEPGTLDGQKGNVHQHPETGSSRYSLSWAMVHSRRICARGGGVRSRGAFSLFIFYHTVSHPLFAAILGFALSWIALNYVPLLLYAIRIVRRKSAELEVAFELEHKDVYALKYTFQPALLLLPLVVPILAIVQEIQKRSRLDRGSTGVEETN